MTMKNTIMALSLVVAVASACHHGQRVESMTMPTQPNGAQAIIETSSGPLSGELLAGEDDGLILLSGNRLVRVPLAEIRTARFNEFPKGFSFSGVPGADQLRRLRLISHFPSGISPTIREKLLTMHHQTDWITVP
jgi:hypothetical protein